MQLMLVCGGWTEASKTNSIEVYNYQTNVWLTSDIKMKRDCTYFGLEIVNDILYAFAGSDSRELHNDLFALDLSSCMATDESVDNNPQWVAKKGLSVARCYVSSAQLDGQVYALGGFDRNVRTKNCERYDPATDEWTAIADMNHGRSDASAVVLNGRIYIAGGINDTCVERSMEYYDKVSNKWTLVKPMISQRTSFSLVNFRGCIWAIGGNDGNER